MGPGLEGGGSVWVWWVLRSPLAATSRPHLSVAKANRRAKVDSALEESAALASDLVSPCCCPLSPSCSSRLVASLSAHASTSGVAVVSVWSILRLVCRPHPPTMPSMSMLHCFQVGFYHRYLHEKAGGDGPRMLQWSYSAVVGCVQAELMQLPDR